MTVETVTGIHSLDVTLPRGSDLRTEGSDHLRAVKSSLKQSFPNVQGVVSPTHTELSAITPVYTVAATGLLHRNTTTGVPLIIWGEPGVYVTGPLEQTFSVKTYTYINVLVNSYSTGTFTLNNFAPGRWAQVVLNNSLGLGYALNWVVSGGTLVAYPAWSSDPADPSAFIMGIGYNQYEFYGLSNGLVVMYAKTDTTLT